MSIPGVGLQYKSDDPPSVEDGSYDHEADVSPHARSSEDGRQNCDLQEARSLFDESKKGKSAEEVRAADVLTRIKDLLQEQRDIMKDNRTALLQLQYLNMVDILRIITKAERTGKLHLQALSEMFPYLAAAGHNLYTTSVQLNLQSMSSLETDHSDVYRKFEAGFHIARRSNLLWAGLSTDLVIEQVLLRILKTSGGLSRGRGMTERQRAGPREQDKDMTKSRLARDMKDTQMLLLALEERNPFTTHTDLINITDD